MDINANIGRIGGVGHKGDQGHIRRSDEQGGESFKAQLVQSGKELEKDAINVARVPGETKRMAALLIDSGEAADAGEAILMAQEKIGSGQNSGLSLLRGLSR